MKTVNYFQQHLKAYGIGGDCPKTKMNVHRN